jgi:hypothetical protein
MYVRTLIMADPDDVSPDPDTTYLWAKKLLLSYFYDFTTNKDLILWKIV